MQGQEEARDRTKGYELLVSEIVGEAMGTTVEQ